jgi:hypothetical protein
MDPDTTANALKDFTFVLHATVMPKAETLPKAGAFGGTSSSEWTPRNDISFITFVSEH